MASELTCARRTRKIVEDNGDYILLRKESKKKKNGVRTSLVPKEDKKNLKRPSSIFSPIRSVVNQSTARILEFRDIMASARLSKVPLSSLNPCPQSAPLSSLMAKIKVPSRILIYVKTRIEESKAAGC